MKKQKDCDIEDVFINILLVVVIAIGVISIASSIINEYNKIDSGIVVDKHHTESTTPPTRFSGEKNGKTVEYAFNCSEDEYDSYDIGDKYPKEKDDKMKIKFEMEMDFDTAFDALLEVLDMKWILDDANFEIKKGMVYKDGLPFDERVDMFVALRNILNAHYPNLDFRGDDYITHYEDGADG